MLQKGTYIMCMHVVCAILEHFNFYMRMHLVFEGLSGGEITWHYNEIHHTLPLILLIEI